MDQENERASQVVSVRWAGVSPDRPVEVDAVGLSITNLTGTTLRLTATLRALGLIRHRAARELGWLSLGPQESVTLSLAAQNFPVQSLQGVSQAVAEIHALGRGGRPQKVLTPTLYYRHRADFRLMTVVPLVPLLESEQGELLRLTPADVTKGTIIGQVYDASGEVQVVRANDPEFVVTDRAGDAVGWHLGNSLALSGPGRGLPSPRPWPDTPSGVRFCTTWRAVFADAGHSEDFLTNTTYQDLPASYARADLRELRLVPHEPGIVFTPVWDGTLDLDGCTPYLPVASFRTYQLRQGTLVASGLPGGLPYPPPQPRHIYIGFPHQGWQEFVWVSTTIEIDAAPQAGEAVTVDVRPLWASPEANLTPIAALILIRATTLGYPDELVTAIKVSDPQLPECLRDGEPATWYVRPTEKVCIEHHSAYWKYIVAHEIGHRVATGTGGPETDRYEIPPAPTQCTCSHVDTNLHNNLHCLQSIHEIRTAQGEGWGHFFATMAFNQRQPFEGTFVYYKQVRLLDPDTGSWQTLDPPFVVDAAENVTWMETECAPVDFTNRGVEWDWLVFFRNLWAQDSQARYSAEEIEQVWAQTPQLTGSYSYYWSDLVDAVEGIYGYQSDKYRQFVDKGAAAGVDY